MAIGIRLSGIRRKQRQNTTRIARTGTDDAKAAFGIRLNQHQHWTPDLMTGCFWELQNDARRVALLPLSTLTIVFRTLTPAVFWRACSQNGAPVSPLAPFRLRERSAS